MTRVWHPVQELARGVTRSLRAALRQGALIGVAGLIALLGAGFLVLAGFLGLRVLLGPGWAAFSMGAALLALAGAVLLLARSARPSATPNALPPPPSPAETPPPQPVDAASMAVFMAAFLVGRRLADRWDSPKNS
jgi:hypothetical protein